MKKLFVLLAAIALSASAASAQDWGIGGRLGYGVEVVGQRYLANDNYWEARVGLTYWGGIGADVSLLYNWNLFNWDWTPGNWFLDVGAGLNVSVRPHYLFVGAQAVGKFGYTFENIPLTLSFDYSPAFGPDIALKKGYGSGFGYWGLYNSGISAVYRF